ncbi:cold-inducible RNA-binding protein B-like [Ornithodoros turicata]|uniref:cold-inducible RNA-binding protein B-like n=1 Tax=Ornithodoros turicata TaxID=34597 RepID=UPI0031394EFF
MSAAASPPRPSAGTTAGRIFVGGLDCVMSREDLEREFGKYGKLKEVWMAQNPPGFAFVEFEENSRVDDAVKEMNGTIVNGALLRVERARDKARKTARGGASFRRLRRGGSYQGFANDRKVRRAPTPTSPTGPPAQPLAPYPSASYARGGYGVPYAGAWDPTAYAAPSPYYAAPPAYGAYYGDFYGMGALATPGMPTMAAACDPASFQPQDYGQM